MKAVNALTQGLQVYIRLFTEFFEIENWEEKRDFLKSKKDVLLNDISVSLLSLMVVSNSEKPEIAKAMKEYYSLFQRCKIVGIDAAFYEFVTNEEIKITPDRLQLLQTATSSDTLIELLKERPDMIPVLRRVVEVTGQNNEAENTQRLFDFLGQLPKKEAYGILSLALWEGSFGPPLADYLGIRNSTISQMCRNYFLLETLDDDNDPWYHLADYLRDVILSSMNEEEFLSRHQHIAKHLEKSIFNIIEKLSDIKTDISLLHQTNGAPLTDEQQNLIEYLFTVSRMVDLINQTQDLGVAELVTSIAQRWHHHLLKSKQFKKAYRIGDVLARKLSHWGDVENAKRILENSFDEWFETQPDEAIEYLSTNLNGLKEKNGDFEDSVNEAETEEDEIITEMSTSKADKLINNGITLSQADRYDEALEQFNEALDLSCREGDDEEQALAHFYMSETYFYMRKPSKAIESSYYAADLAKRIKDKQLLVNILLIRGRTYAASHQQHEANKTLSECLQIAEEIHDKPGIGECREFLGMTALNSGNYKEAENHIIKSLEIAKLYSNLRKVASLLVILSMIYDNSGRADLALKDLEEAELIPQEERDDQISEYISTIKPSLNRRGGR